MANTNTIPQHWTTASSLADPPSLIAGAAVKIQTAVNYKPTSAPPPA